jgi:hypothetical protein
MKALANVGVTVFLILAGYILINEKGILRKSPKRVAVISGSSSKLIGQKSSRDLMPFELQRQRINNETVYKFQSNNSGEFYELEESDLDKFRVQLIDFKNVNRDHIRPANMINDRSKNL